MAHHRPAEPREQMSPQERAETRERSMALLRQMLRPHRGALALSIISVLLVSGSSAIAPIPTTRKPSVLPWGRFSASGSGRPILPRSARSSANGSFRSAARRSGQRALM